MRSEADLVYEVDLIIGRERVALRLLVFDTLMLLERELTQADGATFTHSIWVDEITGLFNYVTADPYFMQLEWHYSVIQERVRQLLGRWEVDVPKGLGREDA